MRPHLRHQHKLEELFLRVYVLVDDWLKENETRFGLPKQPRQIASYGELFTIAVVGVRRDLGHDVITRDFLGYQRDRLITEDNVVLDVLANDDLKIDK